MPRPRTPLVIDARPRGPAGPLAGERVLGRPVLAHLLDLAEGLAEGPVPVHARPDEHWPLRELLDAEAAGRLVFATGPPPEGSTILRTDRLYDPRRLGRAIRRGRDPEAAALWRLDTPAGLAGADAELTRRRTYQPLGRFWALAPARALARALAPTRVRPNGLTLASGSLMLAAAAVVALAGLGPAARLATAAALALALVLDTADGHLARLQGTASDFGRWLDALLDELGDLALHAAVAWSCFARDARPGWLVLGMIYPMGKYLFLTGSVTWPGEPSRPPSDLGHRPSVIGPRPSALGLLREAVRLAGHADVRWHLWIVLAAVGRLDVALAAYAVYFPARAAAGTVGKAVRHATR